MQTYVVVIALALVLAVGFVAVFVWTVKGGSIKPVEKVKFRMVEDDKGE
jgi:hypothetical protein